MGTQSGVFRFGGVRKAKAEGGGEKGKDPWRGIGFVYWFWCSNKSWWPMAGGSGVREYVHLEGRGEIYKISGIGDLEDRRGRENLERGKKPYPRRECPSERGRGFCTPGGVEINER